MMSFPIGLTRLAVFLTAAALITACGTTADPAATTDDSSPAATTAPDTTTAPTTTVITTETTIPPPGFPEQRTDLGHGDPTWAVVLAGAVDPEDPAITAAEQAAVEAGYTTGWTDCDEGAAEALGMPGGTITLSVYFDTEGDAEAAAAAFAARGVDGVVAEVRTYCLD